MKKIVESEWGQGIFQGGLYGIEILFLFGISVDLSAFFMGITSGWVSLFTYMLVLGALAFSFLLNLINKKQKADPVIQKHTILVRIILYALLTCFLDIRILFSTLAIHLAVYFLGNKRSLRPVSFLLVLYISSYGYMKGWISMAECMLLILSECSIFQEETDIEDTEKKGYTYVSLWKADHSLVMELIQACILKCIQYGCVLMTLVKCKDAIIAINELKELFQPREPFLYWLILFLMNMLSIYLLHRVEKKIVEKDVEEDMLVRLFHACCIPERIAFLLMMIACSVLYINISSTLTLCLILMSISFILVEILIGNSKYTTWINLRNARTCLLRLFLVGWLVIVKTVYDGIFVDYNVVIMSIFLFYGIIACVDTWRKDDILLDHLLSEEV